MLVKDNGKSVAGQSGSKAGAAKKLNRRTLLKGEAAIAGAAAGSDAIRGFPTIWAQEIKDIELRHVGVSYSVVKAIGDQAAKDLGFKVTMQNLDTSAAINRFISQPNTVDIADLVQHAVRRLRPIARAHRVRLAVDDHLPTTWLDITMI